MSRQVNLGLTFYGGVSLAVFEAGIAYELVRATQFSRTDSKPAGVPEIHVDVITGTSAGGLTAVQMAAALAGMNPEGVLAALVHIWSNEADISELLPAPGFEGQGFLDNQLIRDRLGKLLDTACEKVEHGRLEEDLDFFLTLTNLSGLREPVMLAEDPRQPIFPSTRHVEYEHFRSPDITDPHPEMRERLVEAAVITAGFPVAFPPALKPSTAIDEGEASGPRTRFVYVDGGIMDNRPLGVALDSIAEKPATQRLFLFVDPSETWVPPSYGVGDTASLRLDPAAIASKINSVARSDSIFHDLERVRGTYDGLAVLGQLSVSTFRLYEAALTDPTVRETLETAYKGLDGAYEEVMQRRFNPEAWGVWLMIQDLASPEVRAAWDAVRGQERFALRARLHELMDRLEPTRLDAADARACKHAIDTASRWTEYYRALRGLRAVDARFRQLKYRLWHERFRLLPRWRAGDATAKPALAAGLQRAAREAFEALNDAAEKLRAERRALARELLHGEIIPRLKPSSLRPEDLETLFFQYAQSMQVLEALAGFRWTPNLAVRRITPFDIYSDDTILADARPLAGGSFGAFGGFLDKTWRINDFLVGRLAMRAQLRHEGLIPEDAFDSYLDWCKKQDDGVIARLPPGTDEEAAALASFAAMKLPAGGFRGDADKPAWLLDSKQMAVERLPGTRLARVVREMLDSTRRILLLNRGEVPYSLLRAGSPALAVGAWLVWVLEQSLRPLPRPDGDTGAALRDRSRRYLAVLLIGAVLAVLLIGAAFGLLIAQLLPHLL